MGWLGCFLSLTSTRTDWLIEHFPVVDLFRHRMYSNAKAQS